MIRLGHIDPVFIREFEAIRTPTARLAALALDAPETQTADHCHPPMITHFAPSTLSDLSAPVMLICLTSCRLMPPFAACSTFWKLICGWKSLDLVAF
jgi:hypothetical protein